MKVEHTLFLVVVAFLTALVAFIVLISKSAPVSNLSLLNYNTDTRKDNKGTSTNDSDLAIEFRKRFKEIENILGNMTQKQTNQETALASLEGTLKGQKTSSSQLNGKKILAVAKTQGSLFTTSSASYTPMGMYVTINCPISCNLWIDFFSSSKNQTAPPSAQGYVNTYGLFVDGSDKSIYSQASFPAAGSAAAIALNGSILASPGVHTIDIQAKTTGGTLESDSSFLQVMAIEQ